MFSMYSQVVDRFVRSTPFLQTSDFDLALIVVLKCHFSRLEHPANQLWRIEDKFKGESDQKEEEKVEDKGSGSIPQ